MKTLNPRTSKEIQEAAAFDKFLEGEKTAVKKAAEGHHH